MVVLAVLSRILIKPEDGGVGGADRKPPSEM